MLGAVVLQKIDALLDLQSFVELTIESDEQMDLSDFDVRVHGGVSLDGLGDAVYHDESGGLARTCFLAGFTGLPRVDCRIK